MDRCTGSFSHSGREFFSIEHPGALGTPAPTWQDRGLFVVSWPRWNARLSLDRGKMGRQTAILPRSRPRPGGIGFLFLSDYNSRSSSHHAINQGNIRVPGWAGSGKGGKFSLSQSARCAKRDTILRSWRVCVAHLKCRDSSQKQRETLNPSPGRGRGKDSLPAPLCRVPALRGNLGSNTFQATGARGRGTTSAGGIGDREDTHRIDTAA